jgi:hypothetical protein
MRGDRQILIKTSDVDCNQLEMAADEAVQLG